eukprot:scpid38869/ scgid6071/ TBC1 domain family member 5
MESSEPAVNINGIEKATEADEDGFHSVSNDWSVLFGGKDFAAKIRKLGVQGHLRGCCFRSVCWKVYLDVLPEDRSSWVDAMREKRRGYAKIKQEFLDDPRDKAAASDATFNNPLSLDTESPWNQFFQDEELKKTITQDVDRTHPDMDFFQLERIKEIMSNVLFCFARAHMDLGYRQGIHELLAPIIFVLDSDKRDKDTVPVDQSYAEEMLVILDGQSLEADAYVLLAALMETCSEWYEHGPADLPSNKKGSAVLVESKLFQSEEDANPSSAVVRKMERIQQVLIRKEDPELHSHLSKLAIPPQIFGLRWIRLLFAREFALLDILILWDAIFAHSQYLELVDSVALAMLLFIRAPLIAGSYVNVLQLLLNFPAIADVQYIVQRALFLQDPNIYPRPPNWEMQSTDSATATLVAPAGLRATGSSRLTAAVRSGVTQGARSLAGKTANLFKKPEGSGASPAMSPRTVFYTDTESEESSSSTTATAAAAPAATSPGTRTQPSMSSTFRNPKPQSPENPQSPSPSGDDAPNSSRSTFYTKPSPEPTDPGKRLTAVKKPADEQLEEWLQVCKLCGDRLATSLRSLETQLVGMGTELPEGVDDKVFLSIASMKQVRDLMKGTLGYDLSVDDAEAILSIDVATSLGPSNATTSASDNDTANADDNAGSSETPSSAEQS